MILAIILLVLLIVTIFISWFFNALYVYERFVETSRINKLAGVVVDRSRNPPRFGVNSRAGASPNGIFYYSGDKCEPPQWGPDCILTSYDDQYINMGTLPITIDEVAQTIDVGDRELSFTQDSCTTSCDNNNICRGVFWDENTCKLITSELDLEMSELPLYDPLDQGNLYLKSTDDMIIKGVVYAYTSKKPPLRYWMNQPDIIVMIPMKLTMSNMNIYGFINSSNVVIAMSDKPFEDFRNAKTIIYDTSSYIPNDYRWVMAVPKEMYDTLIG